MRLLLLLLLVLVGYLVYDKVTVKKEPPPAPPVVIFQESPPPVTFMVNTEEPPQAPSQKPTVQVWNTEYYGTMKLAEETGQSVLVLVSSTNCPPCEKLKQELKQENLENYHLLSLNDVSDKDVVSKLKVYTYPTLLVITPQYKVTHKISGYKSLSETLTCLSKERCYCCTNPNCKCGDSCLCEDGCKCEKEIPVSTPTTSLPTQPLLIQQPVQQPIYYQPTPQVFYQPQPVFHQPAMSFGGFGGGMPSFGGGFGGGMMMGGGGFGRGGGGSC